MNQSISRYLSRLVSEPGDSEEWHLKKTIGMLTTIVGVLVQMVFGLLFLWNDERPAGFLLLIGSALFLFGIISFYIWRNYYAHGYYWFVLTIMISFGGTILLGGFQAAGLIAIWAMIPPLLALIAHKPNDCPYWFATAMLGFIGVGFLQPALRPANKLPELLINGLIIFNTISFFGLMLFTLHYYIHQNQILSQLVKQERDKSESLLLNILPKQIAAILKNEQRVIADHFDEVSILFADVVNFTPIAAQLSPTDLVAMLNEVFSEIDSLVDQYGLEKIKTIGDCFMVASGVPTPRADHAVALVNLALDIHSLVENRQFQGRKLSFRIGVNSGSVVAGVIGRRKFIYDLWGDAVNTASRMESHGIAGCIQITDSTKALIEHDFVCEPGGMMQIKGKGEIAVWHVLAKKADEGGARSSANLAPPCIQGALPLNAEYK